MKNELLQQFDPSILDADNIETFMEGRERFDDPVYMDSTPYRVKNWMVKLYHRRGDLTLDKINLYRDTTNELVQYAPDYVGQTTRYGVVRLSVEPVIKVIQSNRSGRIYSISMFDSHKRPGNESDKLLRQLLDIFSFDMNKKLGLKGIDVTNELNTRIHRGYFGRQTTCNITDICGFRQNFGK